MRNTGQYEPAPAHPVDIMREVFREAEFNFDDEEGRLFLRLQLDRVDVQILCLGNPDDVATIIVNLPIRATPEFRPQTGEFLHRLNFGSKRKFWEFDYNDGEIRLAAYMDTIMGPLTKGQFSRSSPLHDQNRRYRLSVSHEHPLRSPDAGVRCGSSRGRGQRPMGQRRENPRRGTPNSKLSHRPSPMSKFPFSHLIPDGRHQCFTTNHEKGMSYIYTRYGGES